MPGFIKRINPRLLYYNLIRSFIVANVFGIPLCILHSSEKPGWYNLLILYITLVSIFWLIILPITIIMYQINIINVTIINNIVRIRYVKFLFEYSIDLWMEDLKVEIYEVKNSYVLKLFNDHFCIRQWEGFDWDKERFKSIVDQLKSKGVDVIDNVLN